MLLKSLPFLCSIKVDGSMNGSLEVYYNDNAQMMSTYVCHACRNWFHKVNVCLTRCV